jgi:DNA topoisomerase II
MASKRGSTAGSEAGGPSGASKYVRLDHREHVLARPTMYIGSIEADELVTWVYDAGSKEIVQRPVRYVAGLFKIFDEVLVNAIDHSVRHPEDVRNIKVDIDRASGEITVFNDGPGIETGMHPEYGVRVPELIFGHLLTSSNYNDDEERIVGGQNGIGAKAANIFSRRFVVETVHAGARYVQTFHDNMSRVDPPRVTSAKVKPFTRITFLPDYARFGMPDGLTEDMHALFVRRAIDVSAVTAKTVSVSVNGEKLACKTFLKYCEMYTGLGAERVHEQVDDNWEIVAAPSDAGFQHVSFVNGVCTFKGGRHVDHVLASITKQLGELIRKRRKTEGVRPHHIRDNLMLFVRNVTPNPAFDSQSKEFLTTPVAGFRSRCELSERFIEKLYKTEVTTRVLSLGDAAASRAASKTDGRKSSRVRVDKLEDATLAGTARSGECALILTEGDSAKSMAVAGLSVVGRDTYGVFPLRGKILNVKDVAAARVADNEEISNMKKILGLETGRVYPDTSSLRYGRIMVMCDQDSDGSHIKGLLFNVFHTMWPSLLRMPGFMTSLLTPIVKATGPGGATVEFYNMTDYENWRGALPDAGRWKCKYYKGLGTSGPDEAKAYFRAMRTVRYEFSGPTCDESLDMAFNKKRADARKEWLGGYDRQRVLTYEADTPVSYSDFVHSDLIHFSNYDVLRSIPSVCDGLKVSQRKILYACLKRNLFNEEVRVAQLAAYVSEQSAYHHGEASLQGAIIGMAQDFAGSNNINLLRPVGMFGTRLQGGKDAGSPRYIYTALDPLVRKLFRAEDLPVMRYLSDDGFPVEPEFYVPVIPMVLVNGALGIGTGFSTSLPPFDPLEVVDNMLALADGRELPVTAMRPWFRAYGGAVTEEAGRFVTRGALRFEGADTVVVEELPVGTWTDDFKAFLDTYIDKNPRVLRDFKNDSTHVRVRFTLTFFPEELARLRGAGELEKELRLVSRPLSTSNMHLFNRKGQITRYEDAGAIMREFAEVRLDTYTARKEHQVREVERELGGLRERHRFITDVVEGHVTFLRVPRAELLDRLRARGFEAPEDLLKMNVLGFTEEKAAELAADITRLERRLEELQGTTPQRMWQTELRELADALIEYRAAFDAYLERQANGDAAVSVAGGKRGGKKSRS